MPWRGLCRATRLCAAARVAAAPVLPPRGNATVAVVGMGPPPPIPAGRWAPGHQHRVPVGVALPSSQTHRSRHARPPARRAARWEGLPGAAGDGTPPPPSATAATYAADPSPAAVRPRCSRRRTTRAVAVAAPVGGGGEGVTGRQCVGRLLANLHPDEGQRRPFRCCSTLARGCCGGSLAPTSGGGPCGGRPRRRRPFVDASRTPPPRGMGVAAPLAGRGRRQGRRKRPARRSRDVPADVRTGELCARLLQQRSSHPLLPTPPFPHLPMPTCPTTPPTPPPAPHPTGSHAASRGRPHPNESSRRR